MNMFLKKNIISLISFILIIEMFALTSRASQSQGLNTSPTIQELKAKHRGYYQLKRDNKVFDIYLYSSNETEKLRKPKEDYVPIPGGITISDEKVYKGSYKLYSTYKDKIISESDTPVDYYVKGFIGEINYFFDLKSKESFIYIGQGCITGSISLYFFRIDSNGIIRPVKFQESECAKTSVDKSKTCTEQEEICDLSSELKDMLITCFYSQETGYHSVGYEFNGTNFVKKCEKASFKGCLNKEVREIMISQTKAK